MEGIQLTTRDEDLDRLRGFATLWVILVHVLYWTDTGGGIIFLTLSSLSFCLRCRYSFLYQEREMGWDVSSAIYLS